ncbi:Putative WW domain-containing protein [Septoria linicola]|uniref:WW domain-containing protein n=1 Tax=Septoria linicola TaxID=215465 RepID=A0A9Q9AY45_9PEZI|nr:Putative WW domain-containing protein [Septoria linicola]
MDQTAVTAVSRGTANVFLQIAAHPGQSEPSLPPDTGVQPVQTGPPLPPGWEARFDRHYQRYYYVDFEGNSHWEIPRARRAVGPPPFPPLPFAAAPSLGRSVEALYEPPQAAYQDRPTNALDRLRIPFGHPLPPPAAVNEGYNSLHAPPYRPSGLDQPRGGAARCQGSTVEGRGPADSRRATGLSRARGSSRGGGLVGRGGFIHARPHGQMAMDQPDRYDRDNERGDGSQGNSRSMESFDYGRTFEDIVPRGPRQEFGTVVVHDGDRSRGSVGEEGSTRVVRPHINGDMGSFGRGGDRDGSGMGWADGDRGRFENLPYRIPSASVFRRHQREDIDGAGDEQAQVKQEDLEREERS